MADWIRRGTEFGKVKEGIAQRTFLRGKCEPWIKEGSTEKQKTTSKEDL